MPKGKVEDKCLLRLIRRYLQAGSGGRNGTGKPAPAKQGAALNGESPATGCVFDDA
ncbi:MAG: hypothetical protein ACOCW1_00570 [Chitinispirillaceae bacterium]